MLDSVCLYKKQLLTALTTTGSKIRYDPNINNHHHFLCLDCGRLYDIDVRCPLTLNKKKLIKEHKIQGVLGYFKETGKRLKKAKED